MFYYNIRILLLSTPSSVIKFNTICYDVFGPEVPSYIMPSRSIIDLTSGLSIIIFCWFICLFVYERYHILIYQRFYHLAERGSNPYNGETDNRRTGILYCPH